MIASMALRVPCQTGSSSQCFLPALWSTYNPIPSDTCCKTGLFRFPSSDWHQFRAIDQEWEKTHYMRQSTICGMVQGVIQNARKSGAPKRFDRAWVKILQDHLGAYKHAEFGLGTAMMQAQRYGFTQMINNAILTNSSYKLRFAQDLTLYLSEIGLDRADTLRKSRPAARFSAPPG
jgi:propane monooxygenase small subunit